MTSRIFFKKGSFCTEMVQENCGKPTSICIHIRSGEMIDPRDVATLKSKTVGTYILHKHQETISKTNIQ